MSPRTVFAPYARLFAVPGAAVFSFAGWVARLPISTMGLGTVLLVAAETGSYGLAGAVSGTFALASAFGGPLWARAMDRRGQGRVLRRAMAAFLVLGAAFLAAVLLDGPLVVWFVLAGLTGACAPNIGSMVRARWAHALEDVDQRRTAFAFESVVDEVLFIVGPPVVTFLAALVAPPAGYLTGLLLGALGGWWLARLRASEPPVAELGPAAGRRWAALGPPVLVVTLAYTAFGAVFGGMDVVVVAYAAEEGAPAVAGVALAVYAAGSLVAGLAYGVLRLPGTLASRFLCCALLFGTAAQLLFVVDSLTGLIPTAFLAGLAIAPVLVSGLSLVESVVPRAALTEALSWTTAGLTAGLTAGAAVTGAGVDAWGAETAFAVPALSAALGGLLALAGAPLLRRSGGGAQEKDRSAPGRVELPEAG